MNSTDDDKRGLSGEGDLSAERVEYAFSPEALERYERILTRYPSKRAALMPVLWLAQREFGWLPPAALDYVARLMGFPLSWVSGVATFYTMYLNRPVGRSHLQICTGLSCMLRGSDDIVRTIEERLGIGLGETSADRLFTLEEVECLASCGTAPMMQVNEAYHENLDREQTLALLDRLARD